MEESARPSDMTPPGSAAEYAALRQRIAELEQENAGLRNAQQRLDTVAERFAMVFNAVPYVLVITSVEGSIVRDANLVAERMMHRPRAEWIDRSLDTVFSPDSAAAIRKNQRRCIAERRPIEVEEHLTLDGKEFWMNTIYTPISNPQGEIHTILTTTFDITARKMQELEKLRQQEEQIEQQSATLRELSTPLLTISEGVVVMPLIGIIDSRRAAQMIETLLQGIADTQASYAILDITAVPLVDTQVASTLLRAAQAAQMLGTQVILTGIRPEVAQALIGLGADLGRIHTLANLQNGIAFALKQVRGEL